MHTPNHNPDLSRRAAPISAMAAGVLIRLIWIPLGSGTARFTTPDTESYVGFAERFLPTMVSPDQSGLTYSLQRPPGYPLFLWLVSGGAHVNLTWVVFVQCVVGGALNVWLCWRLTALMFGTHAAGFAAMLLAFDPVSIGHSLIVGTESVFTSGLLATLILIGKGDAASVESGPGVGRQAGIGVACGMLAITRPAMIYFVFIGAGLWWRSSEHARRGWRPGLGGAGLVVAAASLVIGGWFVRNEAVADRWMFSSAQGQNLFEYGAAAMAAEDGHTSIRRGSPADGWADLDLAKSRLEARYPDVTRGVDMSDPVNQSDAWTQLGWAALIAHPRGYLIVAAQGMIRMVAGPGHTLLEGFLDPESRAGIGDALLILAASALLLQYAAALVGVISKWRTHRRTITLLAVPAAFYLIISAGPQAYARFRVPVAPLVCVLAGAGFALVAASVGRSRELRQIHAVNESE